LVQRNGSMITTLSHGRAPETEGQIMAGARDKTVSYVAMRYVQERRARGEFSLETMRTVRSILTRFANTANPTTPVGALTKRHVRVWWSTLNVGASSTRHQLSTVRTFLRWCVDELPIPSEAWHAINAYLADYEESISPATWRMPSRWWQRTPISPSWPVSTVNGRV
jgi:hypothetical protein